MEEKIREIMADIFEMNVSDLPVSFTQSDIENWNSLRHLSLIVEMESAFNVSFEPEDINEMISFEKVLQVVSQKVREQI
jgi:acyl carrier protein